MCWEMGVMAGALVEDTKQLEQRRHFHTCELFPLETKVTSCQNGNEPRGRRGWGRWSFRSSAFARPPPHHPSPGPQGQVDLLALHQLQSIFPPFFPQDLAAWKMPVARENSSDSLPRCDRFWCRKKNRLPRNWDWKGREELRNAQWYTHSAVNGPFWFNKIHRHVPGVFWGAPSSSQTPHPVPGGAGTSPPRWNVPQGTVINGFLSVKLCPGSQRLNTIWPKPRFLFPTKANPDPMGASRARVLYVPSS